MWLLVLVLRRRNLSTTSLTGSQGCIVIVNCVSGSTFKQCPLCNDCQLQTSPKGSVVISRHVTRHDGLWSPDLHPCQPGALNARRTHFHLGDLAAHRWLIPRVERWMVGVCHFVFSDLSKAFEYHVPSKASCWHLERVHSRPGPSGAVAHRLFHRRRNLVPDSPSRYWGPSVARLHSQ